MIPVNTYKDHDTIPFGRIRRTGGTVHFYIRHDLGMLLQYSGNPDLEEIVKDSVCQGLELVCAGFFYEVSEHHLRLDWYLSDPHYALKQIIHKETT